MFSDNLINLLRGDPVVTILTGAGISAESGVPTFRGEDGIWKKFKPEEIASFDAFIRNPELVWAWYSNRQTIIKDIKPNRGHYTIAEFEKMYKKFYLITQNVDGLHTKAGSREPIELHGNIMRNRCMDCAKEYLEIELPAEAAIPKCNACGGILRPDVVWFGESIPMNALIRSEKAVNEATLFFSIGTSAQVQPAASMPIRAKNGGAYLVEMNIEETDLTPFADEFIAGKSGELLPELKSLVTMIEN